MFPAVPETFQRKHIVQTTSSHNLHQMYSIYNIHLKVSAFVIRLHSPILRVLGGCNRGHSKRGV